MFRLEFPWPVEVASATVPTVTVPTATANVTAQQTTTPATAATVCPPACLLTGLTYADIVSGKRVPAGPSPAVPVAVTVEAEGPQVDVTAAAPTHVPLPPGDHDYISSVKETGKKSFLEPFNNKKLDVMSKN